MDSWSLKSCTQLVEQQCGRDMLSKLPNEILIKILSLLPTKSVVVVCFLLNKMMLLPLIISLDFDASPICPCLMHLNQFQRFPSFLTFVHSLLQAHQSPYLTRFRINLGVHPDCVSYPHFFHEGHSDGCIPDLNFTQLNALITFPLTRCGLRELDLRVHVRKPLNQTQFPPQLLMIQTLEILKLDVNLSFDGISIFCLPNLKILHLILSSLISDDAFLTSLVSSCPSLDELYVSAWWKHALVTKISSTSLRTLTLCISKLKERNNPNLVVLDTPNLENLVYNDTLALQYSVTSMPRLVKASMDFDRGSSVDLFCQQILFLISALSTVRQLCLDGEVPAALNYIGDYERLPLFQNLVYLMLNMPHDIVDGETLLAFLYRSPNLETLVFGAGLGYLDSDEDDEWMTPEVALTLETIPCCCKFNLKRVLVYDYKENKETLVYIKFLLKYSLVLEELVGFTVDPTANVSTLQDLPRASPTCSIHLQPYSSIYSLPPFEQLH